MARKLKVFSTQIGFVRAIVAAPSRKAALDAWGVRDDLFARGAAQEVTDPALVKEATDSPGEVLRKPVASGAELISAAKTPGPAPSKKTAQKTPAKPPPSREALDAAEAKLSVAGDERRAALAEIDAERKALDAKREALEIRLEKTNAKLEKARDLERAVYDKALKAWKG